jgi:hypothetical protein
VINSSCQFGNQAELRLGHPGETLPSFDQRVEIPGFDNAT